MDTKRTWVAVVALLLAGCSHMEAMHRAPEGGGGMKPALAMAPWSTYESRAARQTQLDATACQASGDQVCIIRIDVAAACDPKRKPAPEFMKVRPNQNIVWHIVGNGWDFDGQGIKWLGAAPLTMQASGPQVRHWKVDANAAAGYYAYHVLLTNGKSTCEIDPGIWV